MTIHSIKYDKTELKKVLRDSFSEVVYAISSMSAKAFLEPIEENKWNPGQHLGHLYLSTKPITKALTIPKSVLESKFGLIDRPENSYPEIVDNYTTKITGPNRVKAPSAYVVEALTAEDKTTYIELFNQELHQLIKHFDTWSEEDLSSYVLPHPAFGNLSMREMLMFTDYHTRHHCKAIKKAI